MSRLWRTLLGGLFLTWGGAVLAVLADDLGWQEILPAGTRLASLGPVEEVADAPSPSSLLAASPPLAGPAGHVVAHATGEQTTHWVLREAEDLVVVRADGRASTSPPREIARFRDAAPEHRTVRLAARDDGFAMLSWGGGGAQADDARLQLGGDGRPPRTVELHAQVRHETRAHLVLGPRHAYVLLDAGSLADTDAPLVAVPRDGGPVRGLDRDACPTTLGIVGDDPVYLRSPSLLRRWLRIPPPCPGEHATARWRELVRLRGDRREVLYAGYTDHLDVVHVDDHALLFLEMVPLDVGVPRQVRLRTQRVTF